MAGHLSLSETEMRLLDQVCEAIDVKTDEEKNLLKTSIRNDLAPEWTRLVALMESNGPLSVLSEDEIRYINALDPAGRHRQPSQTHDQVSLLSQDASMLGQKMIDHGSAKAAIHDLHQYNNTLESLLVKYKDHARRSITTIQRSTDLNDEPSAIEKKLNALSLKKDRLRREIRVLEDKINNHVDRLEGVTQPDNAVGADDELHSKDIKSIVERDVFETTFPSYDHILEKLNALQGELGSNAVEDDALFHTARRHASQLSVLTTIGHLSSTDQISEFKHEQSTSDNARAINDERGAVYSEIQSLWDEMVPLAHMVVEKDYLKPIMNKTDMYSERQNARDATVAVYTSAMLRFMNERLRVLIDRIGSLVCHLRILSNALMHMNSSRSHSEPIGLLKINKPLSGSDKEQKKTKEQTLLKTIQRQMELYGPIPIDSENEDRTSRMHTSKINRYLMSRQRKGDDLARSMHEHFERVVRAELTDAELAGQLLLDSVTADSAAGCRSNGHVYEDQQVEDSVATVKSQAEEIRAIIGELLEDGVGTPTSAPDYVSYAYNKAAKQLTNKDLEDQERCTKLTSLIQKWGDPTGVIN
ncbi:peptidyl-prolyl cis-trans isomerase Pin1 [Hypoxylon texense]